MKRKTLLIMLLMALFAPLAMNAQTVTVCNGTSNNEYVPFYGYYADEAQHNQMIFPSGDLKDMNGTSITQMVFYIDQSASNGSNTAASRLGTWTVSLGETKETTLSALDNTTHLTQVYEGNFDCSTGTLTLEFDNAYTYNGGNLLVDLNHEAASWNRWYFLGVTATGASYCYNAQRNFLPKTTFTYRGTSPAVSLSPNPATVMVGYNETLTATTYNVEEGTYTISYRSSDEGIATVSGEGTTATVTGVSVGTATITAAMEVEGQVYTTTCVVTVEKPSYCTPAFSYSNTNYGLYIAGFNTEDGETNISTTSSNGLSTGGYGDYYDTQSVSAEAGQTIKFTVTPAGTVNAMMYAMWIDWNLDYDFDDEGELIDQSGSLQIDWTGTISIPATASLGDHRIRIMGMYSGTFDPCISATYGEAEDYKLTVLAASSCPKPSNVQLTTSGNTVTITWDSDASSFNIDINGTVTNNATTSNTYTFTGELSTTYTVKVQANCDGNETSAWSNEKSIKSEDCMPENQCPLTITLTDSYGDGGGSIFVVNSTTETILGEYYCTGSSSTYTLNVCHGTELDFYFYATDDYATENGYVITDLNGDVIAEGSNPTDGVVASYTMNCSSCIKPTNLEATNVGTESAVLKWEGTSASYVLQYRTAAQNINMTEWHQIGEDVTTTATETTYTFDLSDYEGEGYVAIRHYNVTNMFYLDVDNITVTDPDGETDLVSADGTSIPSTWTNQDVDGDGYVWSTSAIDGYFVSQSFDNSVGPLTPDNWLIIPVSNLGGTLSFTAKGQDSNFPAENFGVFVTTSTLTDALQPVAAGNWSDEITTTEQSYQITGLTANTPYEWQVKGVCDTDDESTWATSTFTTTELGAKNFVTEGNWDVADNWSPVGVPTIDDKVIISANATVPAGVVATAKKITLNGGTLTIADGGQLKQNGNVELVMEKEIEAYGTSTGNYYFIASPLTTTRLTFVQDWSYVNAITGNYDLYAFDPTQELEWINYKSSSDHALFTSGQNNPVLVQQTGYLYANEEGITLQFEGTTAVKSNENVLYQELSFNAEATDSFNGWTLIGNPYTCDAYISYVDADGNALDADFYTLNLDNTYTLMTSQDGLAPCTGALISMSATGKVQYSTEAPAGKASMLDMTVTEGRGKVDQARIRFGVGYGLEKKSFRANSSSLYIPQNNKDYAVIYAENTGEMPVNFKAENNGNYTINFSNEEVEFSYLHLIDNLTGADVDLLANPSYTFEAKTTDYTSRFKLVFATGNSVNGNDFGFISNNHLKIFGIEGNATVKVMDITGRTLSTENFNGSYDKQLNLSAGVYMIQLIQGNDVKTQKIVIR